MIDRIRVKKEFKDYISDYDLNDDKIRLKAVHTYKVAENSERIALSLELSPDDVDLAWLIGMLHDIGRFEQLRRYHTFIDADSIDHAQFGADLLFKEGLIRRFIDEDIYDGLIESSIRMHNLYILPETLKGREEIYAKIIRDADKIDIYRVNIDFSPEVVYDTTAEELSKASICDEVMKASLMHDTVNRSLRKSPVDSIVGHISLVYGIYYPESIKILQEQGNITKLMKFRNDNPETTERLKLICAEVNKYMENFKNDL
ncbi:MAG: HD domain-containing protein [Clostridiales bacterium]|nr:HD domain-containing protein [Clostridiales bacterium]